MLIDGSAPESFSAEVSCTKSARETKLFEWLARKHDPDDRQVMLDWFAEFVLDPLCSAHRIPGQRAPIYLVVTAAPRVTLTFLLAEQFKTIQLIQFGTLD